MSQLERLNSAVASSLDIIRKKLQALERDLCGVESAAEIRCAVFSLSLSSAALQSIVSSPQRQLRAKRLATSQPSYLLLFV